MSVAGETWPVECSCWPCELRRRAARAGALALASVGLALAWAQMVDDLRCPDCSLEDVRRYLGALP
jgi:hypothetical protein